MPDHSGLPIHNAAPPEWMRQYLTAEQLKSCTHLLIWVIVASESASLRKDEKHLMKEMYMRMHTLQKGSRIEWRATLAALHQRTGIAENTITSATRKLEEQGWLIVVKQHRNVNLYIPAWPLLDCVASGSEKPICGVWIPKKEKVCGRPPGYGTAKPGVGPCCFHGGEEKTARPHPLRSNDEVGPQRVRSNKAEEDVPEPVLTAPAAELDRTGCEVRPQDLRFLTAAGADQYDQSGISQCDQLNNPGLPHATAEVEVPPADLESDEDRDVVDGGEAEPADDVPRAVEPKRLTAVPDECIHGRPGGYLPGPNPPGDRDIWPTCRRCQNHVTANQCRKKRTPCQQCNDIRAAAGQPLLEAQEIA